MMMHDVFFFDLYARRLHFPVDTLLGDQHNRQSRSKAWHSASIFLSGCAPCEVYRGDRCENEDSKVCNQDHRAATLVKPNNHFLTEFHTRLQNKFRQQHGKPGSLV
jgi:hypothetical protein